jgi:hypothetical protein
VDRHGAPAATAEDYVLDMIPPSKRFVFVPNV